MAGVLTPDRPGGAVREVAGALIGMRRSLTANAPGGSGTVPLFRTVGLGLAVATLLAGLVRFDDPGRWVDLLAALYLGWLIGWAMGPIAVRGAGQGLRPEWFALLPVPPRRLAAGLVAASFVGAAPAITLVAFAALPVAAARLGVLPLLVAVPAAVLELVLVVALSRVVVAADRSDWLMVAAALVGLAVVSGLLLAAWAGLLARTMRRPAGRPPRIAGAGPARQGAAGHPAAWPRLLPVTPTGAVVAKELHAWRRDSGPTLVLLMALLISGLNLAVPAVAFSAPALLPFIGLGTALIISTGAANVYGEDGTALWLTRMVPGAERADVRGRQAAWLLAKAPALVVLAVVPIALSGQGRAWPWVLATLAAVLGATPGLMVWLSVTSPVPEKDPHRRSGPFDTGDDPSTAGALATHGYLMLALVALAAAPCATLVLLGGLWQRPALQAAGVLAGVATGGLLYWWAATSPPGACPTAAPSWRDAAVGTLWTVGIICVFPQGLVPMAFNLFGVDPQVRVWFVARYAPQDLQLLVAAGFLAVGLLAVWWAEAIRRRPTAPG